MKYRFLLNDFNHEKYRIEYFIGVELYEISNERKCYSLFDNLCVQRKIRYAVRNFYSKYMYMYLTIQLFSRHRHIKNVINSEWQKKKNSREGFSLYLLSSKLYNARMHRL